jgi:LytS/YehU family sensor histidine kinase
MAIKKGVYNIPTADGSAYNEIHFRTDADMVSETDTKKFVTFADNMKTTSKNANAVISANVLGGILNNCKIVISDTKPTVEDGYNILWIDTKTLTTD